MVYLRLPDYLDGPKFLSYFVLTVPNASSHSSPYHALDVVTIIDIPAGVLDNIQSIVKPIILAFLPLST